MESNEFERRMRALESFHESESILRCRTPERRRYRVSPFWAA
jgi:hypothetical protein